MGPILLEGGTIRTLDPAAPVVERLAVTDGRIAARPAPDARRVDLGGRCVLPGFNDAHVHFPTWAVAQHEVRLEDTRSLDEALARVREALAGVEEGRWLRGRGWRSADWSPAVEPTKQALDEIAGDTPVA